MARPPATTNHQQILCIQRHRSIPPTPTDRATNRLANNEEEINSCTPEVPFRLQCCTRTSCQMIYFPSSGPFPPASPAVFNECASATICVYGHHSQPVKIRFVFLAPAEPSQPANQIGVDLREMFTKLTKRVREPPSCVKKILQTSWRERGWAPPEGWKANWQNSIGSNVNKNL